MSSQEAQAIAGAVLEDGTIVEMIYDRKTRSTALTHFLDGNCTEEERIEILPSQALVPYSSDNPLLVNGVVRFPSKAEPYGSVQALTESVRGFIHRYVDLSDAFESVATAYVLFSWVYDAFNELPYLRVRGDYGTGKTRFLSVVGSVMYRPIFGSGASTVSPLFHLLDEFSGTLVLDEADFRFTDEKADLAKILNNGNVRGFPVLRAVSHRRGEFRPRAFRVYGPKLVGSRGGYDDKALESRFITEEIGGRPLRNNVPLNLPNEYEEEAERLRNQLLMYRFEQRSSLSVPVHLAVSGVDTRTNQILLPLLSVVHDASMREAIIARVKDDEVRRRDAHGDTIEATVLTILRYLFETSSKQMVSVGDIATVFREHAREPGMLSMTDRRMGVIIRTKLGLRTHKSNGRFVISSTESGSLARLYGRYGIGVEDVKALREKATRGLAEKNEDGDMGSSGL